LATSIAPPKASVPIADRREASERISLIEERFGYQFQNKALVLRALSHRSLNSERKRPEEAPAHHNEQLEFLGDSVLGLLVSEHLFKSRPDLTEGKLSVQKARIVSSANLYEVARGLGLGECLILGRGEELSGGREKRALLADALEALLGAVYLDAGLEAARDVVNRVILSIPATEEETGETKNFKASLQELAQAHRLPQPAYVTIKTDGPDHAKIFTVEARVGAIWSDRGTGATKKEAGQMAARVLWERMRKTEPALFLTH
jgi:ribonuclease III